MSLNITLKERMDRRPSRYRYQHYLNPSGSSTFGSQFSGNHVRTMYGFGTETPRDINLLRMSRETGPHSKHIGHIGISESIAMHQRKLRDTEARIDHAMDLVTRSFGVNQRTGLTRHTLPRSPEVRKIREMLMRTQRVPSLTPIKSKGLKQDHNNDESMSQTRNTPMVILKKRKPLSSSTRQIKSGKLCPISTPTLRIYKTKPIITPYIPPSQVNKLNNNNNTQDKIDRTQILPMSVFMGNTQVYSHLSTNNYLNTNFVNTFANMKSFNSLNDSNPAGLEHFCATIDMRGFADNEISFQCEGTRVIITGHCIKKTYSNARTVTEFLELPPGIYPEKLRIARDADGVLHIQENIFI